MFAFLAKIIASSVKMLEWLFSRIVVKDSGKEACICCVVVSNGS